MEFFQIFLTVLMGLAVIMYYVLSRYKQKKRAEYGNDERWKNIVLSATMVVYHYYAAVLAIVVLGNFLYRLSPIDIQLRLSDVFGLLFLILLGGSTVEFIAFQVYDKRM